MCFNLSITIEKSPYFIDEKQNFAFVFLCRIFYLVIIMKPCIQTQTNFFDVYDSHHKKVSKEPIAKKRKSATEITKTALIKTPQELIHIKHKITLRQYKYWLLMIRAYRECVENKILPNDEGYYNISTLQIENDLGYELVQKELREDLETIRIAPIQFNMLSKDGKHIQYGLGFISQWKLEAGLLSFTLPPFLEKSIKELDLNSSIFQKINFLIFNSFDGKYDAILYKLCKDYVGVGKTQTFTIEQYREYMGLDDGKYLETRDFIKNTVTKPVEKVNENPASDIVISVSYKNKGRKIIAFQFLVHHKNITISNEENLAFRNSRIGITIAQQKIYLQSSDAESIYLSIERANEYIDFKNGAVANIGAMYRKAIEHNWGSEFQLCQEKKESINLAFEETKKKKLQTEKEEKNNELRQAFRRSMQSKIIKELPIEKLREYAEQFIRTNRENGKDFAKSYDSVNIIFTDSVHSLTFDTWLRSTFFSTINEENFSAWLMAKKK